MIWAAHRSSRPELSRQLLARQLNYLDAYLRDFCGRRTDPKPLDEFEHGPLLATDHDLDAPVGQVARVTGDAGRAGALLGRAAVKHSLDAARNQAATRNRSTGWR